MTNNENNSPIQIIYHPGLFGNLIRFILDRSLPDSRLKNIKDPFDLRKTKTLHDVRFEYSDKFTNSHQLDFHNSNFLHSPAMKPLVGETRKPEPDYRKIIVTFDEKDEIFVHRACFYRSAPEAINPLDWTIIRADQKFVEETFGKNTQSKKMVAKELLKIEFHAMENVFMQEHKKFIEENNHYHFNIRNLFDVDKLINEIKNVAGHFNIKLDIDKEWLVFITDHLRKVKPVDTMDRCSNVYDAIINKKLMNCGDLDILEQAWIETHLEKDHDCPLFPYGTRWFNNTDEVNEFIDSFPTYLQHMNPRLPWHNNRRNPFYLKGKLDDTRQ